MMGICWLLSENRHEIPWRTVLTGLGMQFLLAVLLIKLPFTQTLFTAMNQVVLVLDQAATAGTTFVFGYLGGGEPPFTRQILLIFLFSPSKRCL